MVLSKTLRDIEPFKALPDEICSQLAAAAALKTYPKHCQIFKQQDPPSGSLYLIKSGEVEIHTLAPGGVEMVVDIRSPGDFFGGTPVFSQESYTAGARTRKQTECYLIPATRLVTIAADYPHIKNYFTRTICFRVRSLYANMVRNQLQDNQAQMEAFPFQKKLADIMTKTVASCHLKTSLQDVARRMTEPGVGAVIVYDDHPRAIGIISQRDLISRVLARDADSAPALAEEVMTTGFTSLSPDTYMFEATSFMMGHKISQLPIMEHGEVVGIVTMQDLLRYRSQQSMLLVDRINNAQSLQELKSIKSKLPQVAGSLLSEMRNHCETVEILSYIQHNILRRGHELVLTSMKELGLLPPADIRYCLIIMGSGGRKEMLLGPDQDNGFIFEDFADQRREEVDAFFVPFAEKLVDAYAEIGYPRCDGKVMVNNPLWRGRLTDWHKRIHAWVNTPEPQRVRYSTIFFDFMPLVGDASLCQDLRNLVHDELRKSPLFLYHMMELDFQHKVPLNLLGGFSLDKEHKGLLSTKQTGSIFIVDCVRMFMLEKQIYAATTIERIERLEQLKIFSRETAEHLKAAFEAFTYLRLRNEISLTEKGQEPSHYLDPQALSKEEQELLKEAFRAASKLQDSAKRHFNVG